MRWGDSDQHTLAARAWWRSERQTFLPVPSAASQPRQALFTIAVDVQPLTTLLEEPGRARALLSAVSTMSDAVLEYRGLLPVREPLLRWLERCAAQ